MSTAAKTTATESAREKSIDKVIPTLYIGVGGTGAEVLFKLRRKILNQVWIGVTEEATRLDSLSGFPFAEFIHIDLDSSTVVETGKSTSDPLQAQVAFKPNESYVKKLDLGKYIDTDERLRSFPLVAEWFPLTKQKIEALNINPEKGAGQIRSISRLYFFDRYQDIKSAIDLALSNLRNSVNNTDKHKRLGLTLEAGALRVVVVASTAGGTGSGSFIDIGYLSKILLQKCGAGSTSVTSILMLPTGFKGANAGRTQANTYAALMELETCMRGGGSHVGKWSESDADNALPTYPYDDIYFFDTENVADAKTDKLEDCFQMVADILFEDFSNAEFSNKKRSISVNQNQHKSQPYSSRVDRSKYGDLKLTYNRSYSAFGQAILDTQLQQKQSNVVERQVGRMLGVFFGVSADQTTTNIAQPTETDRDAMLEKLHLKWLNEEVEYDFSLARGKFNKGDTVSIVPLVTELLREGGRLRFDDIKAGIEKDFDDKKNSANYKDWPGEFKTLLTQIRRDTIRSTDTGSGLHEGGIQERRQVLRNYLMADETERGVISSLWSLVDNKEKGGQNFTIALIHLMKDRMGNAQTGYVIKLEEAATFFGNLSNYVYNDEIPNLTEHLRQAVGKLISARSQSEAKWQQLSEAVKLFVDAHMKSVACREAALLVQELSQDLGFKASSDSATIPIWEGFIGDLERCRQNMRALMQKSKERIAFNTEAMKQSHAMFQVLPTPASLVGEFKEPEEQEFRTWADDVFKKLGGTRGLYGRIKNPKLGSEGCADLLRTEAIKKISSCPMPVQPLQVPNPLFAALDELSLDERKSMLVQTMQRAMPWAPLKLADYLKVEKPEEQYKCLIGVKEHAEFKKRYGDILLAAIPSTSKMTATQVGFVEISEPGRLVCYVELSGLPLPAIRSLSDWHAAYKVEDKKIPVHTHKQVSKFVHVIEMNESELASRYSDFELMVQALALRDLSRSPRRNENGRLSMKIEEGERSVGDERVIRLNGFDNYYRTTLQEKIENSLGLLKNTSQKEMWYLLMLYYLKSVYPIKVTIENNTSKDAKHLPTLVCENLLDRARLDLLRSGKSAADIEQLMKIESEVLNRWSEVIVGSDADPYPHEVGGTEGAKLLPKRALKMEVFGEHWTYSVAQPAQSAPAMAHVPQANILPPAAAGFTSMPPPMAAPAIQWHLHVNGTNYGPFALDLLRSMIPTGQFSAQTMVWREGMTAWLPACTVPELAAVFMPTPVIPPVLNTAMPPPMSVPPPHIAP